MIRTTTRLVCVLACAVSLAITSCTSSLPSSEPTTPPGGDGAGSGGTPTSIPGPEGPVPGTPGGTGRLFRETFTGEPASPESRMNALPGWFAQPIMQGTSGWDLAPEPMDAQHDMNCGPPPATHRITTYAETVYSCKNHLMTAINPPSQGTASGIVSLKPDHMVDLTRGEAVVKVDVSTLSPSAGDWWEIWITPPEDQLVAPTDHWFHQVGPPRRAVYFQVVDSGPRKYWLGKVFDDYRYAGGHEFFWLGPDIRPLVSLSDTRRDTYELRITRDRVKMLVESTVTGEMKQVDEFAIPPGVLGDSAVVQFQQSNYEPEKNGKAGCTLDHCPSITKPATWHWDNVEISPAVPYHLIGTQEYQIWAESPSKTIHFDEPAPSGADLLFVAFSKGNAPELSFDGGLTWTPAPFVKAANDGPGIGWSGDPDLLTYRIPVPEGATSAEIRGRDICSTCGYDRRWAAQNFHLVARRSDVG